MAKPVPHVAGQSSDEKILDVMFNDVSLYASIVGSCIGFVVYTWASYLLNVAPDPIFLSAFLVVPFVFSIIKLRRLKKYLLNLKQGRQGERKVGYMLENFRSDGAFVYHDIVGDQFNIDHVVVSPKGVFTVETKNWSKQKGEKVSVNGDSIMLGNKPLDEKVYEQCKAEAGWLKNRLKDMTGRDFEVMPVLVFPDWFIDENVLEASKNKGLMLFNPKNIQKYVATMPDVISSEDLSLLKDRIGLLND